MADLSKRDDDLANLLLETGMTDEVRYDHARSEWHVWNGVSWKRDSVESLYDRIQRHARKLMKASNSAEKVAILANLLDRSKKESVSKSIRSSPPVAMVGNEWDTQPTLLGCRNGVLDLVTLAFDPKPDPTLNISRQTSVDWDPTADCPLFINFLGEIMSGDSEMVDYLLLVLGYALFGWQREQKFWVWVGQGQNGKGTLAKVVARIMGDYAESPDASLYTKSKYGTKGADAPNAALVRLQGLRFTWLSEPHGEFNDELVKAHTGDDPIMARDLYTKAVGMLQFRPTHTIVFLTNDPPPTRDVGMSMRRRVRLIEFAEDFSGDRENKLLEQQLLAEAPGILNLLARAAQQWFEGGLIEPKKVTDWSAAYIEENDPLARFAQERCVQARDARTSGSVLYDAYVEWCRFIDEEPRSLTAFGTAATRRWGKVKDGQGRMAYKGIGLKSAMAVAMEEPPDE